MTACGCRIQEDYEPSPDGLRMLVKERIAYCPLHAQAEAMREVLRRCADGAFLLEQRGELVNLARQVLAKIDAEAPPAPVL